MEEMFALSTLPCGASAIIQAVGSDDATGKRLRDLGFVKGSCVRCQFAAALGDPRAYHIHGTVIALRNTDAAVILCKKQRPRALHNTAAGPSGNISPPAADQSSYRS